MEKKKVEHKVYGVGYIHIPDGNYTKEQLQSYLTCFDNRAKALRESMNIIGDRVNGK